MKIERLKELFKQWTEFTIEEKDVSELMALLQEADTKKQLNEIMEEAYKQMKDFSFFSDKQKKEHFLNTVKQT